MALLYFLALGSPPRVRGKPSVPMNSFIISRITPACAGKTEFPFAVEVWKQDHPRVCGENTFFFEDLKRS